MASNAVNPTLQSILQAIMQGSTGATGFGTNPPAAVGANPAQQLGTPNPLGQGYFPTGASLGIGQSLSPARASILNVPQLTQQSALSGVPQAGASAPAQAASPAASTPTAAGWQFQSGAGGGPYSTSMWVWGGTGLPTTDPYGNPFSLPSGVTPNNGIASYSSGGQNYYVPGFGTGTSATGAPVGGGAGGQYGGGGAGGLGASQGIGGANNPEQGGSGAPGVMS